jgi:hypothetical protein
VLLNKYVVSYLTTCKIGFFKVRNENYLEKKTVMNRGCVCCVSGCKNTEKKNL